MTAGTVFADTKLPLTVWFLAMHLLTRGKNAISALELSRHLGVRHKAAWLMKQKLMQVMQERDASRVLDGRVEIDDAYLGGERTGGKPGRGSENKVPFVAAVQTTADGKAVLARFDPIPFTTDSVEKWAKDALVPTAEVVSDGLACFGGVLVSGASHCYYVTRTHRAWSWEVRYSTSPEPRTPGKRSKALPTKCCSYCTPRNTIKRYDDISVRG